MSIFKGFSSALFGIGLVFGISSSASAIPVNVTFTTTVAQEFADISNITVGDTWTLTFVVDNGGASLSGQSWGQTDIVGDVIGSASSGYSATYGTVGALLTLTTNAGGALIDATYSDLNSTDNTDSLTAPGVVFTTTGPVSNQDFALLALSTEDEGAWSLVLETQGGGDVPEPGALALFGAGLIGLALVRRRKRARR